MTYKLISKRLIYKFYIVTSYPPCYIMQQNVSPAAKGKVRRENILKLLKRRFSYVFFHGNFLSNCSFEILSVARSGTHCKSVLQNVCFEKKMEWLKGNTKVGVLLQYSYNMILLKESAMDIFSGMSRFSFGTAVSQNSS